jgi:hypothetical protein
VQVSDYQWRLPLGPPPEGPWIVDSGGTVQLGTILQDEMRIRLATSMVESIKILIMVSSTRTKRMRV